jgi:Zn ribbon nucleic-acid-binding protein
MFRKDGVQRQECVACGYHADMVFEQNFKELQTRVNRTETEKQSEVAPVRFVDLPQQ